jgi:DNA-binding IclR family transcriptional regulator
MSDEAAAARSGVRAVARAIAVLRAFSIERPLLALSDIALHAGLDKGTTRRLLLTLAGEGLITQDATTHRYSLGLGMMELGAAVPAYKDLRDEAAPFLSTLAQKTQSSVFLSVYRDGEALCLARVHGDTPVQVRWWNVGGRMFVHSGGGPRVLLAFQSPEEIERRLAKGKFPKLTHATEIDPKRIRRSLDMIRKRGWELAIDDVYVGLAAVGVPIRDKRGAVIAAVSLGGLVPHLVRNGRPRFLAELNQCARDIGDALL